MKDISDIQDGEDAKAVIDLIKITNIPSIIREWLNAPDATTNITTHSYSGIPGLDSGLSKDHDSLRGL